MSPVVKRKGERFTLPSKYLLFILTILCTIMMLVTFGTNVFNRPFNRVVGYVIVPLNRGSPRPENGWQIVPMNWCRSGHF